MPQRGSLQVRAHLSYLERLGYDPENITILVSTKREIEKCSKELEKRGYRAENIKDPQRIYEGLIFKMEAKQS